MTVASPIHMHREIRGNQSSRKQAGEAITTILSHGLILGHVTTSTHISNKTISLSLKCLVSEGQRQQGSKEAKWGGGGSEVWETHRSGPGGEGRDRLQNRRAQSRKIRQEHKSATSGMGK